MKGYFYLTVLSVLAVKVENARVLGPVVKPPNDKKEYRALILDNGIKVLLVADPSTPKAAAALTIPAGGLNDPREFQGLAHFVEHAVFCFGNEKFPEENGYYKFISKNGGDANAGTDLADTTYYFHVANAALRSTLERHAAMFINPLFPDSGLEREVKAVDSEHQKNIPNEVRRGLRIESLTAQKGHPFTQFLTGSLDSLWTTPKNKGLSLRTATVNFFEEHYSSNLMHLVVYGAESLDDQQQMVEEYFTKIPNRNRSMVTWTENPIKNVVQERIDILPLEDTRTLKLVFPVDYFPENYKTSAFEYLKYVLSLEGEGSLHALLVRKKQWVESVVTIGIGFSSGSSRGFTNYAVDMTLTKSGTKKLNEICRHFFQYLEMLRNNGPQNWIWEEIRKIGRIKHWFMDDMKPDYLVFTLAENLVNYPVEKILHADHVDETAVFDRTGISNFLGQINPNNFRMIVACKDCGSGSWEFEEEFYQIKYNKKKIDGQLLHDWINCGYEKELYLPTKNDMIPANFELKIRDEQSMKNPLTPRKLVENDFSTVWYLQDTGFLLPKAIVTVEIYSPLANLDPISVNLNGLWVSWMTRSLWKFRRTANLAGLDVAFGAASFGLKIMISGYNEKLWVFMSKVFQQVVDFKPDAEHFETMKESRIKFLRNKRGQEPADVIQLELNRLLLDTRWSAEELLEDMYDISEDQLETFVRDVLTNFSVIWLFYGNLTPEESLKMSQDCENLFHSRWRTRPLFKSQMVQPRMIELAKGSNLVYKREHPTHSSSGTTVLFQIDGDSMKDDVLVRMLVRIVEVLCFDQLRTKEQLGYSASTEVFTSEESNVKFFRISVQGTPHPNYVQSRIDSFLKVFEKTLNTMTEEEFATRKTAEIAVHSMKPQTMGERNGKLFREIHQESHNFERELIERQIVERLTLTDLQDFFKKKIANPLTRRRLAIHVVSTQKARNTENRKEIEEISDPATWKKTMYFLPSLDVNDKHLNHNSFFL